ncbi:aminopeptidase P N-terminal domain-containing protein [Desulfobacterales bacterium HSG16]|nr:aminopeptidase P N-terminal domain-containing protein [Desulfobacterales bacterium HSG16]
MKYFPIDTELFKKNRAQAIKALKPFSTAVLNSNDIMPSNADGVMSFIQNTDLFYLSGIDQEESIMVLCPDSKEEKHSEILFIKKTDEKIATWEGEKLSKEEATRISGIKTVYWTEEFEQIFKPLAMESEYIYLNTNEHLRADTTVQTSDSRFIKWCMTAFPVHKYERLAPVMHDLRAVKSEIEIDLIKTACKITESAFLRILSFIRPGVWEFEIEAEIAHEFIRQRSRGPAFETIVASGEKSCILHYVQKNRQCAADEVVLIDFGAEYANYAADVTRTVPVSKGFSPRQKEVYNAVLRVQKSAIEMLTVGNTLKEYHKSVGKKMEQELIGLGLIDKKDVASQPKDKPLYKKFFMHGTSHYIGLDVHDYGDRYREFAPGMVFSCEPGIYIKDENLGIRLENDILITENGPVDLTGNIPIEIEEIEDLMNQS